MIFCSIRKRMMILSEFKDCTRSEQIEIIVDTGYSRVPNQESTSSAAGFQRRSDTRPNREWRQERTPIRTLLTPNRMQNRTMNPAKAILKAKALITRPTETKLEKRRMLFIILRYFVIWRNFLTSFPFFGIFSFLSSLIQETCKNPPLKTNEKICRIYKNTFLYLMDLTLFFGSTFKTKILILIYFSKLTLLTEKKIVLLWAAQYFINITFNKMLFKTLKNLIHFNYARFGRN